MTDNNHPITPPPELIQQWLGEYFGCIVNGEPSASERYLATQAARWGADQELEACCEWIYKLMDRGLEWSEVFIDHWESAELAAAVLDLENPEDDKAVEYVENQFMDRYGIDLNTFAELARRLVPLCAMDKSPLTDTFRKGFVRDGVYIVKTTSETP